MRVTKHPDELKNWLRSLEGVHSVLAAGGDGSAIALVNAIDQVMGPGEVWPTVGILPLGTGNAWAHASGAFKLGRAVEMLRRMHGPLPTRRFGLVRCEGVLTSFAGCGWDAEILNDYKEQLSAARGPAKPLAKTVYGYLGAMLLRTTPKTIWHGQARVRVEHLEGEVFTVSGDGRILAVEGAEPGQVLYEGPASVAGCASCPEFGYGFRAFPFAERLPGYMNVRVYDRNALAAIKDIPKLWRGVHPLRGMRDWFSKRVRMTYSRPMALQIGGDAVGTRTSIEYAVGERDVRLVDWRACA